MLVRKTFEVIGYSNPYWDVSRNSGRVVDHRREKMVPPARFQRATFRLGGGRSMQLSYGSRKARIQETVDSSQYTTPTVY